MFQNKGKAFIALGPSDPFAEAKLSTEAPELDLLFLLGL